MTKVTRLVRVGMNVSDLDVLTRFYAEALGFEPGPETAAEGALCSLIGVRRMRTRRLRLGGQQIELAQSDPPGAPYPQGTDAADLVFQHFAIVTPDIAVAHSRAAPHVSAAISTDGPAQLPARSGGVVAWKFRDPDGHPLEFLQFPHRTESRPRGEGIDHSAIAVADVERSIGFYQALGLAVASRQVNTGPEQDCLDGMQGVTVDVVALAPAAATPHVELLGYRAPRGRAAGPISADAIAATRLVFEAEPAGIAAGGAALRQDPDGHRLLLLSR